VYNAVNRDLTVNSSETSSPVIAHSSAGIVPVLHNITVHGRYSCIYDIMLHKLGASQAKNR